MLRIRIILLLMIASAVIALGRSAKAADEHAAAQDIDHSVKPGDDFYRYANGGWLKTAAIPAGKPSFDTRAVLVQRTSRRVSDLIQEAAKTQSGNGTITQKVGEYYASFMG